MIAACSGVHAVRLPYTGMPCAVSRHSGSFCMPAGNGPGPMFRPLPAVMPLQMSSAASVRGPATPSAVSGGVLRW